MISVKDSGQGIHHDILPKLFTKFATKSETGTGLGLFISKSLVEAHGGRNMGRYKNDDCNNESLRRNEQMDAY